MPNTLAHIGIQGPINTLFLRGMAPQWMLLGCILPDLPWISQRLLKLLPGIDPVFLRLYSVIQSSLFFCMILAGALAWTTRNPGRIFLVLAINSFLHLLIDATEIKWANGVQLLAPFSWSLQRLDWFVLEHPVYYLASGAGLALLGCHWRKIVAVDLQLIRPVLWRMVVMGALLTAYLAGPFFFIQPALRADNHFCQSLMNTLERSGKKIEIDRSQFSHEKATIRIFTGETLALVGQLPPASGRLSIQGVFRDSQTIEITAWHAHSPYRDQATIVGILLVFIIWFLSLLPRPGTFPPLFSGD